MRLSEANFRCTVLGAGLVLLRLTPKVLLAHLMPFCEADSHLLLLARAAQLNRHCDQRC